jgi:hemoglobin
MSAWLRLCSIGIWGVSLTFVGWPLPLQSAEPIDAFGGKEGLVRLADRVVDHFLTDDRIKQRFARTNLPRLRRLLAEQFCAQLGGGCVYTGRDMVESHQQFDLKEREFSAVVEDLQLAMDEEHIDFAVQNILIARLAPMKREIIVN